MGWEPLSDAQRLEMYASFNATAESIRNDVQYLTQWMEKQPHLPKVSDEKLLTSLLLQCKNSVEKTKTQIQKYYTARATLPEIFTDRDPCQPWFRDFMTSYVHIPLPKPTPDGHRIFVNRLQNRVNMSTFTAEMFLKACQMLVDIFTREDSNPNVIIIMDHTHVVTSPAMIAVFFAATRQYIHLFQNVLKFRPKKIYLVNVPPMMEASYALIRRVMKKKLTDRMVIWDKPLEDLVHVIPKEVLPLEYGGDLKSIVDLNNDHYEYMCEFREWFLSENNVKADITRIPKDNQRQSDLLALHGMDGSFRTLRVD